MHSIITIIHVLAAAALIGLVLIQHGKGADAGAAFGSGSAGTVFGARGPASFLTRTTAVLAAIFFLTSLSLAYLAGQTVERRSITERVAPVEQSPAEVDRGPADVPRTGQPSTREPGAGTGQGDVPATGESGGTGTGSR